MIFQTTIWIEVNPVWSEYGGLNRWQTSFGKVRKTAPAPEDAHRFVCVPISVDVDEMFASPENGYGT